MVRHNKKNKNNVAGNITAKEIVQNYGSIHKTSGGGKQVGGVDVKKFVKKVTNNRVLDVYLKYMGIKTLTTATLVPFGLIMGGTYLRDAISLILNNDQKGGNFLEDKIPVLDDDLIGNYLKLSGLSMVNLSPATLVPLGILMVLYQMSLSEQTGGRVVLPPKYFNDAKVETYSETSTHSGSSFPSTDIGPKQTGGRVVLPPKYFNDAKVETYSETSSHSGSSFPSTDIGPKQTGGRRLITGNTIPPNVIQDADQMLRGQSITHHPFRTLAYKNNDMQLSCKSGNCGANLYHSQDVFEPKTVEVKGIEKGTDTNVTWEFGPSGLGAAVAKGASNVQASSNKMLPGYDRHSPVTNLDPIVSPSMAGGGTEITSHEHTTESTVKKVSPKAQKKRVKDKRFVDLDIFLKEMERKAIEKSLKKGGGSDWLSTHNSRGAVNSPGMNQHQFRSFTSTADYISNKALSKGAADHFKPVSVSSHETLYSQTTHEGSPDGHNVGQYGGDDEY